MNDIQPRSSSMGEVSKYIVSAVILGMGVSLLLWLSTLAPSTKNVNPDSLVPMVKTFKAMAYSGQLDMEVSGTVVPFREIKIAAEVGGRIEVKYPECEAGNFVTKGTKLLEIDRADLNLNLETTLADIEQAKKGIEEVDQDIVGAELNLKIAESDYQLQQSEYERNLALRGSISKSELNAAERNLLSAEAKLVQAKNSIGSLQARKAKLQATLKFTETKLAKTKLDLKRSTIAAPDDGVIVKEMTEQGNIVRPGDQLLVFEDTRQAEILCNLATTDLNWIRENAQNSDLGEVEVKGFANVYHLPKTIVTIYDSAEPNVKWQGVLERFDGIGRDEVTKTFPCRIVVAKPVVDSPNGPRALVRGMYVKCQIQVYTSAVSDDRKFLSFPTRALRPGNESNYVWIEEDLKLKKFNVEVVDHAFGVFEGKKDEPFVVVKQRSGELKIDDRIVTSPLSQPIVGTVVELEHDSTLPDESKNASESPGINVPTEDKTGESRSARSSADSASTDKG